MTKYQYNVNKNSIEENGEFVAYLDSVDGFRIARKLNVLSKENEQLKSAIKDCIRISESNGALSPMRLKSIFYHFEL